MTVMAVSDLPEPDSPDNAQYLAPVERERYARKRRDLAD